jgi:hypothetical protein
MIALAFSSLASELDAAVQLGARLPDLGVSLGPGKLGLSGFSGQWDM